MYEPSRRLTTFPAVRAQLFGTGRLAGIATIAAGALLLQSSDRLMSADLSLIVHGPIQPHRNDDGSLARGKRDEVDTSNWSGYAVAKFETGQTYLGAKATWTVPTVTFQPDAGGSTAEYSSTWVGIGGFCENAGCTQVDNTLIQLGTEQDVSSNGTTQYYAWYEMLPQFPFKIPITVSPNDSITASLICAANCSSKKQTWTLSMVNATTGQHWSKNFTYGSSRLSAVWIEEAPYSGGVLPLADFTSVPFESLTVNNPISVAPTLDLQTNGIQMTDPWGQTAIPSNADTTGFDVCWENGATTACSLP